MTGFDLPTNLLLFVAVLGLCAGVLVLAYAPLAWLAARSERFAEWVDRVVEAVL